MENSDDPRACILGASAAAGLGQEDYAVQYVERAVLADPDDTAILYNVACTYAVLGRHREALDALEKCVGRGWSDKSWIEHDPDLNGSRGICGMWS